MPFFDPSIPDDKNKPCSVVQGLRSVSKYDILSMLLRQQGAAHNGRRLATLPERG